jgi:hypothetical protein
MRRCLAAQVGVAFALSAGPAAALDCPPAAPVVEVTLRKSEPTIDNTLTQPALQRIAAQHHYPGGRVLGYYHGELRSSARTFLDHRVGGGMSCIWVARVTITAELDRRTIWIIRERRPGTCAYDVVLGHERKHESVDDAVLEESRERLSRALVAALATQGATTVRETERSEAEHRLTSAVEAAFRRATQELTREREARQHDVDTPVEYRRVAAACDPTRPAS